MYAQALALLSAAFGAAMAVIGAAWAISRIGSSATESIAKQPEASEHIRGAMIVTAALIEGIALFALGICFMIQYKIHF